MRQMTSKRQKRRALGKLKAKIRAVQQPPLIPLSRFPLQKFEFLDQKKGSIVHEHLAFRLVFDPFTQNAEAVGTATVVGAGLLVTAKHVLMDHFEGTPPNLALTRPLYAVQVLPGPRYYLWLVETAEIHNQADLAFLNLSPSPMYSLGDELLPEWKLPIISPIPPSPGATIAALGYRNSSISFTGGDPQHLVLDDEPMVSTGTVREIHYWQRDRLMPYPCFQIGARFDGGMSGGPVLDESGALCGVVSKGYDLADDEDCEPISYASTLWPLFGLVTGSKLRKTEPKRIKNKQELERIEAMMRVADLSQRN
jgi:hypothetical protein